MNADRQIEDLKPPTFTHGGRTWTGRFLSFDEWRRYEPALVKIGQGKMEHGEFRLHLYRLAREIFPRPWWKVWDRSVGYHLLRMPLKVQLAAFFSFAEAQGRANGTDVARRTPGSNSPPADAAKSERRSGRSGSRRRTGVRASSASTDGAPTAEGGPPPTG